MPETMDPAGDAPTQQRVWDPVVRIFHWVVAGAFFVAYFTEGDFLTIHAWAGYTVGTLVVLRIAWGFVGPVHSRFSDFIYPPATVWRYLVGLATARTQRYLGHSPAGGAMVVALLACQLAVVWTGLELYAVEEGLGPLASSGDQAGDPGPAAPRIALFGTAAADSDEGGHDATEDAAHDFWEELHELSANLALVLVILHVVGVAWSSFAHRENLVLSMVTGNKRARS
jgi:cytochrome b